MTNSVNYLDKTEPFGVVNDACYSVNRSTFACRRLTVVETDDEADENSLAAGRRARTTPGSHTGMHLRTAPRASP
jgi:hypothetical protein